MSLGRRGLRRLVLGAGEHMNRRTSLYLYDRGRGWQPTEPAKRRHLLTLLRARDHTVFVEAGTWRGDTVAFFHPHTSRIFSVELDDRMYAYAAERFRNDPTVTIVHGDAATEIPGAVAEAGTAPLVYLDAHHTGTLTPGDVTEPAPVILTLLGPVAPPGTTIVVDDLRLYGTAEGYPTLDTLTGAAADAFPNAVIRVGLDSLVVET